VAELVDAHDSKSCIFGCAGSIPAFGTKPLALAKGFIFFMAMWLVYVLKSLRSGKRYVGITQHLDRRLGEHNAGKSKFTSGHVPWSVLYSESFETTVEARAREKYFKSAAGKRYLDKILRAGSLPD